MKSVLASLNKSWDTRVQCCDCLSFKKKKYLKPHFQYCNFNYFFLPSTFHFHSFESYSGFHLIDYLSRKLKIFLNFCQRPSEPFPISTKIIQKLERKLSNFEQILSTKVLQFKDFLDIELFLIFFSYFKDITFDTYLSSGQSRPESCLLQKDEKTQNFFENFSVRLDSSLNLNSSNFLEDGEFLVVSDNSKIFLFELPSKRFIRKITGNRTGVVALISKFKMIVYQDTKFDLVVYNFWNGVKEFKIKNGFQVPVDYFKVSTSGKYLFAKFVNDKIVVWNILNKKRVFLFYGMGKIDFVLHPNGSEIVIFSSDAGCYDFKTGMHLDTIVKNQEQIDLVFFQSLEHFFYSDVKKLVLVNVKTKEKLRSVINNGFFYLSKNLQVFHSVLGENIEVDSPIISNSECFSEILKKNYFAFASFALPNIFCRKFKNANGKTEDFPLKFILEDLKFICKDGFIEKMVFNADKVFVAYSNRKRFMVYAWDLMDNEKKLEIEEFTGKFTFKYLSCEYLMLQDKAFHYFYNLKTRLSDRFMKIDSDLAVKENLEIESFTFTKNKKFVVFQNQQKKLFKVLRFSSLPGIFHSKIPPVFNDSLGLIGMFGMNEVKVLKYASNEFISTIPVNYEENTFKGLFFIDLHHVCLIFSKKMKFFSTKSHSFVFKTKIKPISVISELLIQVSTETIAFCNESNLVLISLKQIPSKSEFILTENLKIQEIALRPSLDLLIAIGTKNSQMNEETKFKPFTVFLIDLPSKTLRNKISENLISTPFMKKDFLFFLHAEKVVSLDLRSKNEKVELDISDYHCCFNEKTSKFFYLSGKSDLFRVKVAENVEIEKLFFESSSSLKISEGETCFGILDHRQLVLFDSENKKISAYDLKKFEACHFFIVNNRLVVLVSENLKFLVLDAMKDFAEVTRFSMKNERISHLKVVSSDSGDFLVYGKKCFFFYGESQKFKLIKDFQDLQILDNLEAVLYKDTNGMLKIIKSEEKICDKVAKDLKTFCIGGVLRNLNNFWIYDQVNKVASIYA